MKFAVWIVVLLSCSLPSTTVSLRYQPTQLQEAHLRLIPIPDETYTDREGQSWAASHYFLFEITRPANSTEAQILYGATTYIRSGWLGKNEAIAYFPFPIPCFKPEPYTAAGFDTEGPCCLPVDAKWTVSAELPPFTRPPTCPPPPRERPARL